MLVAADLALQYSIALCGLSVGPPILNSITVVMSVVLAYFLDGGINKPELVFTGGWGGGGVEVGGRLCWRDTGRSISHTDECGADLLH